MVFYTYGDGTWADLLTAYEGTTITYDSMGNPLSYYNGQNYTFTWENGRQLASAAVGNKTVSFEYNADGIRTEKHLSQTHDVYYRLIGDTVIEMFIQSERGNERLVFTYDDSGAPCRVQYYESETDTQPTNYYYMLNLQGDVIRLIDYENVTVANYTYDAWGNIISITDGDGETIVDGGHIAHLNPIRYRGYFYDSETGFYYCNSRYYDPQMRRFINSDGFLGVNNDMATYNLFTYCGNNPVIRLDDSGTSWSDLIDGFLHTINTVAVAIGIDTAAGGAPLLCMFKIGDAYHVEFDCWQSLCGYNSVYDFFFDIGTDMKTEKFPFEVGGKGYTIWMWKGDYINLGAGAELGIYLGDEGHRIVDKNLAIWMGMTLYYKNKAIAHYYPGTEQWWITSFNPDFLNNKAKDINARFILRFYDSEIYNAFKKKWHKSKYIEFREYLGVAVIYF